MTATRPRSEDGDAVTELVLVVPVLMFLILAVVQFGVWYHAQHVTVAAAQEGARAARLELGTADDGERTARDFLVATGSGVVVEAAVSATRDAEEVNVIVTGRAVSVIPGLSLRVRGQAAGAVETFRADIP